MNCVILSGRTTSDVQVEKTSKGTSVVDFCLAVKHHGTKGSEDTSFIPCTAYGKTAETMAMHVGKGSSIAVEGTLTISNYTAKNGTKHSATKVIVQKVEFLSLKKTEGVGRMQNPEFSPEVYDEIDEEMIY